MRAGNEEPETQSPEPKPTYSELELFEYPSIMALRTPSKTEPCRLYYTQPEETQNMKAEVPAESQKEW